MRIAVAGGTGLIGTMVVRAARASGHQPVVLARSAGVDLVTGAGLDAALVDVEAVIDVSNLSTTRKSKAVWFFSTATTNLLTAGRRAGISHHLALSIVGCDRVPFGYYVGKRRQEELVLAADVPTTVLRPTQFHEFAAQMLERRGPVVLVPAMLSQPVAAAEVADLLVQTATRPAVGLAPEMAGPEQLGMPDLVRRLARAHGSHRPVVTVPLPGAAGTAMRSGALLPRSDGPRGRVTFSEWLAKAPDAGQQ